MPHPSRYFGPRRAIVLDNRDPLQRHRLQVELPTLGLNGLWAEACLPPVPLELLVTPDIGARVWIEFEAGDPSRPVWLGVLAGVDPA